MYTVIFYNKGAGIRQIKLAIDYLSNPLNMCSLIQFYQ